MKVLGVLAVRILVEARWTLALSTLALFSLGWLGVNRTARFEAQIREAIARGNPDDLARVARRSGLAMMDVTSVVIEMNWWNLPMILLPVVAWAIGRGSFAAAGDLERGTMDLILSRPVARSAYLLSHVLAAVLGLVGLAAGLVAGHAAGLRYNTVADPPPLALVLGPAANLASLGFAVFGFTLVASSLDRARWRPNLIGSVLTLGSFILTVVANMPGMEEWKPIEKFSIFRAYNPVEVVSSGKTLGPNVATLIGLGVAAVGVALAAFSRRDLPAGS